MHSAPSRPRIAVLACLFSAVAAFGADTPARIDASTAVGELRNAAEQGNASAQAILGARYVEGAGVPQDYVLAHMWANLAASQLTGEDQKTSSALRDLVAGRMTPAQVAEAQRLAREWKPAPQPSATVAAAATPSAPAAAPTQDAKSGAKGEKMWQQGRVTDISGERVYAGSDNDGRARYVGVWRYTIDAGNAVYIASGSCSPKIAFGTSPCRLTVNGPVQFAIGKPSSSFMAHALGDEEPIYLKDESGKEYKLSVAKKVLK